MTSQNAAAIRHQAVTLGTRMTLISGESPVDVAAELFYTTHDPLAVHLGLAVDGSPAVEWVFSRDLLRDGLTIPSGSGDIHLFPVPQGVVIDLLSPTGPPGCWPMPVSWPASSTRCTRRSTTATRAPTWTWTTNWPRCRSCSSPSCEVTRRSRGNVRRA